jgi:hypothetical protein
MTGYYAENLPFADMGAINRNMADYFIPGNWLWFRMYEIDRYGQPGAFNVNNNYTLTYRLRAAAVRYGIDHFNITFNSQCCLDITVPSFGERNNDFSLTKNFAGAATVAIVGRTHSQQGRIPNFRIELVLLDLENLVAQTFATVRGFGYGTLSSNVTCVLGAAAGQSILQSHFGEDGTLQQTVAIQTVGANNYAARTTRESMNYQDFRITTTGTTYLNAIIAHGG